MRLTRPLEEFIAATFTPLHADGSIAPELVPMQAIFLAAQGIKTVFITGTTGECHSLTCDERLEMFNAWAHAGRVHGVAVIAHVGGNSIEDARTLARRAAELELAAISALAPSYYKPEDLESLPIERFLLQAPARIPSLAGVKFTNVDLISYRRSLDVAGDRFDLPWGIDEAMLGAMATGARGGVGSTYNFAPNLYVNMKRAFERGDLAEARRLQSLSIALVEALSTHGYIGTAKALLTRLGVPAGPARAPLGNPTLEQFEAVFARLNELGFQEWGAKL